MKIGDLVRHKLNSGPWFGVITKRMVLAMGTGTRYFVEWQTGTSGWFRDNSLEVMQ